MAAPTFGGAGTGLTDAGGAWTWLGSAAPGINTGDVLILQILQDGSTAAAVAVTSVGNGWEDLAGTDGAITALPGNPYPVGSPTAAYQHLFIMRRTAGAGTDISGTNSTSEDLYIQAYRFTNVSTGTTLATVIENGSAGATANGVGTDATALDTGVTTLGADRLALNFVAVNDDNVIPAFTGETGGDWTLAVSPYAESSGTDGAIGLQQSYVGAEQHLNSSPVGFGQTGANNQRVAQAFIATGNCTGLRLYLGTVGSPSDNVNIAIQTNSAGAPSGTSLASTSIAASSLTGTITGYDISLSATLTPGTTYWIVLTRSGALNDDHNYQSGQGSGYYGGDEAIYNGSWNTVGGTDLTFAVRPGGATINGGSASITDSDAWGVVGFALIGTTVSGPATYYGATATPVSVNRVVTGKRTSKSNPVAFPISSGRVVAGRVTAKSKVAQAYTFGRVVAGAKVAKGQVSQAFTLERVVAGKATKRGQVAQAFTVAIQTAAKVAAKGAVALPVLLERVVNSKRTTHGQVTLPITLERVVDGTVTGGVTTHYGATSSTYSFERVTDGKRTTHGQVSLPLTLERVTSARVTARGAVTAPFVFGRVVSGTRTTHGAVALPITLERVTAGNRTSYAQVTQAYTFSAVTAGRVTAKGAATQAFVFGFVTSATRTTHGAVTLPLTFGFVTSGQAAGENAGQVSTNFVFTVSSDGTVTVNARRALVSWAALEAPVKVGATLYGASSLAITVGRVVDGRRTTHSAVTTPLTFERVTAAKVTAKGAVVFPITFGVLVDGAVAGAVFGRVSLPISFERVTAGTRTTFGVSSSTYTFDFLTSGVHEAKGAVSFPITFGVTTSGATAGAVFGAVSQALSWNVVSTGRVGARGAVSLPLTWAVSATGRLSVRGALSLPIALERTTLGRLGARGRVVLPITFGITTEGFIFGETFGAVSLPITFDSQVAGTFHHYGSSSLVLVFDVVTGAFVQGTVITGHIAGALTGISDGRVNGHIDQPQAGTENGSLGGHVEQPLTGVNA